MYIQPNTNIHILRGVPLDNNYNHTIYFEDRVSQYEYFYGKKKHTLIENSYQRVNKGVCRVGIQAELLYECNYMMFQNKSFGTKWFYAFINKVEYINNNVSEIYFEIDVMQTWLPNLDYQMKPCFVEREHSVTDNIGDNIIPESVNCGEYKTEYCRPLIDNFDDKAIAVVVCDTGGTLINEKEVEVKNIDGIITGGDYHFYKLGDIILVKNLLNKYREKPEAIVSMYMLPLKCLGENFESGEIEGNEFYTNSFTIEDIAPIDTDTFEGYKPRNMKMYTYPYNFYRVDNANGDKLILRYEFFENLAPKFKIDCTIMQPVELALRPLNYRGLTDDKASTTECLTLSDFPTCTWSNDSFTTWLGKNAINIGTNLIEGVLGMVLSKSLTSVQASTASVNKSVKIQEAFENNQKIQNVQNVSSGILGTLASAGNNYISADTLSGRQSNNVNWAKGFQQFYGGRCHITRDIAESIDDFFTMFGYQTNKVKVPNINSRPLWNYVKTNGFALRSGLPNNDSVGLSNNDISLITSIFDSGITFWKNGDYIGSYQIDNSPA